MDVVKKSSLRSHKAFLVWLFAGILTILLGIILESHSDSVSIHYKYMYNVLCEFIKNIGIAIVISSIFTYILSTKEFVEFIKDKLISIIVSKGFISGLSYEEKKEMLKIILKPSKEVSSIYSGINQYFSQHVEESLSLFHRPFRSGYSIIGDATYDKEKDRVKVETDMSYRIYKVMGDYEKLAVGFEDDDVELKYTKLYSPDNDEYTVDNAKIEDKEKSPAATLKDDPAVKTCSTIEIPEAFRKHSQMDVCRRVVEYGTDHWHLYSFRGTLPMDKFNLCIRCHDDIKITKYITYGPSEKFKVANEGCRITVSCNDWMQPGLGVAIVLSKPIVS